MIWKVPRSCPSGIVFSNQDLSVAIVIPSKTAPAINFQATAAEVLLGKSSSWPGIARIIIRKTIR
jgi:hypothetical protein